MKFHGGSCLRNRFITSVSTDLRLMSQHAANSTINQLINEWFSRGSCAAFGRVPVYLWAVHSGVPELSVSDVCLCGGYDGGDVYAPLITITPFWYGDSMRLGGEGEGDGRREKGKGRRGKGDGEGDGKREKGEEEGEKRWGRGGETEREPR